MPFSVRHFDEDDKLCQHASLQVLHHVYPPETVAQVLTECHAWEQRERKLNMITTIWVVIALSLFPRLTVAGVLRELMSGLRLLWSNVCERVASEGAICQRRMQLGVTPLRRLMRLCCHPLASPTTPGAFALGRRVMAIDGTCQDVADSRENAQFFGRLNSGPTASPFPQLRGVYLQECGTHAIVDAIVGRARSAEAKLARGLLRSIGPDMLVLLDAGLFSGALLESLRTRGAHGVVALQDGMLGAKQAWYRLRDGSYLAWLRPGRSADLQRPLLLRVICYQWDAPELECHGQTRRLVTTWLNSKRAPARTLIGLYHERWEVELSIDEHKNHLCLPHRPLRSQRPSSVLQEFYGLLLLHYGVRTMMSQAANVGEVDPDRISFTHTVELMQRAVHEFALVEPREHPVLFARLLSDMREVLLPPRRLRFNARVVKRPLSRFRRKRFWHLQGPHFKGFSFLDLIRILLN